MQRFLFILGIVSFLVVDTRSASADRPEVAVCTTEIVCSAHSQLMKNIMTPISASDLKAAVETISGCAAQKHPFAMFSLAYAYETGNGVKIDRKKALEYHLRAALSGHPGSLHMIPDYYSGALGKDVERNAVECYAWARVGEEMHLPRASHALEYCAASPAEIKKAEIRKVELQASIKKNFDPSLISSCR